ncbi:MAG: Hsp70 family protein [Acetobacteraceae bacterium]|nr:Hsp70 family protein [Acetobacteraceae bacterium]
MTRHTLGIDLGTTNCALAFRDLSDGSGDALLIPQVTAPGVIEERLLLPSFIYVAKEGELPDGALALPWDKHISYATGEFARSHGVKVPTRLVASAKSWLSYGSVDRTSALLPWQAPPEVERISPVEASARYLRHLAGAWKMSRKSDLDSEEIVLTVPASFDAAARELTTEAAKQAGLHDVTLLEEPQAALYAWIQSVCDAFRTRVKVGDIILVVDVGGGTSDFSLIAVTEQDGDLQLTRMAVGDHILLGGDNMDLTLAHHLAQGKTLDPWQFATLTHGCRQAKELLFADLKLQKAPISIPSRGSALVGGTIKMELTREDITRVLIDGFMPEVSITDLPRTARRTGLTQVGLPYAQDPGITRHLAAFLTRQSRIAEGKSFVHPTAILFNGGVFKAHALKERVTAVLNEWLVNDSGAPVKELEGGDLDLAVARGAAYYGWVRHGHGIRIRGGTARAYYVGIEAAMPAVPGFEPPVKALCVAPFGMEEGSKADIPSQEFALVVGEPTVFRFFSSSVRREDRAGDMIDEVARSEEFEEVAPIETTLSGESGKLVLVNLQAAVTEVGTLELRCLEKGGSGRWKLELNVRAKDE